MSKQFTRDGSKYDIEEIETILLSKGYPETLFSDLEQHRPKQNEGRANCPFCGETAGHFYYSKDKPVWRCFKCEAKGNWFTYLRDRRGLEFREALLELAGAAGVQISDHDQKNYEGYVRRADLMEEAQTFFRETLKQSADSEVKDYLLRRGYSEQDIEGMALGAYTDTALLKQYLIRDKGFSEQEVKDSGLLNGRGLATHNKLAIPLHDSRGRTIGIAFRLLVDSKEDLDRFKEEDITKYRYSTGYRQKEGLTGLSTAIRSPKKILVEGVLDAHYVNLKAQQEGLQEPIIALGTNGISEEQVKALELTGTEEVILALDSDSRGLQGTANVIDRLQLSGSRISVYVAPLADYAADSEKVDPDSLVREKGIGAFIDACSNAESWSRWYANWLTVSTDQEEDISTDRGRDLLLRKLSSIYARIDNRQERLRFLEPVELLGFTVADLESKSQDLKQAREEESVKSRLDLLKKQLETVSLVDSDSGHFSTKDLEDVLSHSLTDIRTRLAKAPEPYLLPDLLRDVEETSDGLFTGYEVLDKFVSIPQGAITIVAGRPGQGKTTLQLNLLVNMLRKYPEKRFYFFSYEEAQKALAIKILMILSGVTLLEDTNYGAYVNYLKEKQGEQPAIDKAIREYQTLTESGRLWLMDTRAKAGDLCKAINYLHQEGDTGAVFIDYIQKIPPDTAQSIQYLNIKEVSGRILETAVSLDIPVILGAQLGRPDKNSRGSDKAIRLDNLRESGDIEQDANLVLGLHCPAVEKMEEEDSDKPGDAEVELNVRILKNRAGVAGKKAPLLFNRPILTITDGRTSGLM